MKILERGVLLERHQPVRMTSPASANRPPLAPENAQQANSGSWIEFPAEMARGTDQVLGEDFSRGKVSSIFAGCNVTG
jgi:hypothetical protein